MFVFNSNANTVTVKNWYGAGSLVENGDTAGQVLARVGTVSRRQRRHVTQAVLKRNVECIC